ncbi:MAG TPA: GAF domain-containing protein [Gemmatimonadaceae bacterium]|nr:GAF domain-containing protein [Gemmatimonadaceae bacterium]
MERQMDEGRILPHESARDGPSAARRARQPRSAAAELSAQLAAGNLQGALALLNARTRFRFTGVYAVEGKVLRNVELYDRENPTLTVGGGVCPIDESYCSFIAATGCAFATGDSRADDRLFAHAKRDSVLSYAGVPIRLASGCVVGTLCHYDGRPRFVTSDELGLLEEIAPAFAASLGQRAPRADA